MTYDFYVRTKQDLMEAIRTFGFVPYFSNSVPGFSLEGTATPTPCGPAPGTTAGPGRGR